MKPNEQIGRAAKRIACVSRQFIRWNKKATARWLRRRDRQRGPLERDRDVRRYSGWTL